MRRVMPLAALLAAGLMSPLFAADDGDDGTDEAPLDVETILANPLDEDAYRNSRRCISNSSYQAIEILDEDLVLFHGRSSVWLNRLSGRCRGLRWDMVPNIESHGSRICERDRFRGHSRSGFPDSLSCTLGMFEKIDEGQVESLRAARGAERGAGS